MTFDVRISGARDTRANLERLRQQSPARARRAVNRTIGVARIRVIKAVARIVGVPQRVVGGRKGRKTRDGRRITGKGYIKQVRATRRRAEGALVGLIEGIRFQRVGRKRLGASARKPGGLGQPFDASLRSGHQSLFERMSPQSRVSKGASPGTTRYNLPIREVVIPTESTIRRALRSIMRRVARTVYPQKIWEEIRKSIKPVR